MRAVPGGNSIGHSCFGESVKSRRYYTATHAERSLGPANRTRKRSGAASGTGTSMRQDLRRRPNLFIH